MSDRSLELSPQTYARVGGILYLFIIAELALALWLTIKGVNLPLWNARRRVLRLHPEGRVFRYSRATIIPRITIRAPSKTICLMTTSPGIGCTTK